MDAVRAFFTKSGHFFFDFQNRAEEASPHPPPPPAPLVPRFTVLHFYLIKVAYNAGGCSFF